MLTLMTEGRPRYYDLLWNRSICFGTLNVKFFNCTGKSMAAMDVMDSQCNFTDESM